MTSVTSADFVVMRYVTFIFIGHAASALPQDPVSLYILLIKMVGFLLLY
jgi:hypothetical protein